MCNSSFLAKLHLSAPPALLHSSPSSLGLWGHLLAAAGCLCRAISRWHCLLFSLTTSMSIPNTLCRPPLTISKGAQETQMPHLLQGAPTVMSSNGLTGTKKQLHHCSPGSGGGSNFQREEEASKRCQPALPLTRYGRLICLGAEVPLIPAPVKQPASACSCTMRWPLSSLTNLSQEQLN